MAILNGNHLDGSEAALHLALLVQVAHRGHVEALRRVIRNGYLKHLHSILHNAPLTSLAFCGTVADYHACSTSHYMTCLSMQR